MDICYSEGSLINTRENKERLSNILSLKTACSDGAILEQSAVLFDRNKNLIVPLGPVKGVIPYLECAVGLAEGTTKDIAVISRVGKPVCFVITGFSYDANGNQIALLSRRAVQKQFLEEIARQLVPGDIIACQVTHLEKFGCFVDIGRGISALLPIDAISVSRINHPADRISVGMRLRCVVRSIDQAGRLLLTHKELLGTWQQNAGLFSPGETVLGIVRSIEEYGVFVELTPNLAGLADLVPGVSPGETVSVFIKNIIPERMKIKLVIIDALEGAPADLSFRYFIDSDHIDRFVYSPENCDRTILSTF